MPLATLATILVLASFAMAAEVPRPGGGDDHAWMTYASVAVLPAEDLEWLGPEIKPLISTYCHLPDLNWNNYGKFGGWSGLPDQPRRRHDLNAQAVAHRLALQRLGDLHLEHAVAGADAHDRARHDGPRRGVHLGHGHVHPDDRTGRSRPRHSQPCT